MNTMNSRRIALILIALLLSGLYGVAATPEFSGVKKPDPDQLRVMKTLNHQIAIVQKEIAAYHEDLQERECTASHGGEQIFCAYYQIDENGESLIPLDAVIETFYGQRQRFVRNELAKVRWEDKKPVFFQFETRRGAIGKGAVLIKRIWGNTIAGQAETPEEDVTTEAPLDLVVNELLSSGKGDFVNFRFPTEDVVRDSMQTVNIDGRQTEIQVIYVRDPAQKINIMKEYLRMLRLLNRRLDWTVRAKNARQAADIERLLRE